MSCPLDPLSKSIKALERQPKPYCHIVSLRFPNYRRLKADSILKFDFPITVLLGRNGTNKSSILHALYGSPKGQSIADFWFETDLDIIPEKNEDGRKQSVVHSYDENGILKECIKARAPREGNPDYWEPVRHTKVYGFAESGIRVPPIQLHVSHLDFRGELPAFDKYFYFPDPKHLEQRASDARSRGKSRYRKQDYLRNRSKHVKMLLDDSGDFLSSGELEILSYILERRYTSSKVVKHSKFHGHEGWTILFEQGNFSGRYSDAFAGSGESAATLLVHNVMQAPEKTLILLDEPETSLHPRAQRRMLQFLAHQCVRKSLQVVIATHSFEFAENLPQAAIKVLVLKEDGFVYVDDTLTAQEALHEIDTRESSKTILVEDERAKEIIKAALKESSDHATDQFKVVARTGGTSKIYHDILTYAKGERKDVFIILDGDHRNLKQIPTDGQLPQGEQELKELISQLTRGKNEKGPDLRFTDRQEMTDYIRFLRSFVFYLPSITPEQLVWDDQEALSLACLPELPQNIQNQKNFKERLHLLSQEVPAFNADSVFTFLLSKFLRGSSSEKDELTEVVAAIRSL